MSETKKRKIPSPEFKAKVGLAGVSRATVYAHQKPKPDDESDLLLSRLIDCEYTRHPFYGSRKMEALQSVGQSGIKAHRSPQSLGHKTPNVVYQTAMGGGVMILDKYPRSVEEHPVPLRATECSSTAKARSDTRVTNEEKVKLGQRRSAASEVKRTA